MRFNPKALPIFVGFCLFLAMPLSPGSGWAHAAEAIASILILISLSGFGFMRDRQRPR
jgi:hypothetical protein